MVSASVPVSGISDNNVRSDSHSISLYVLSSDDANDFASPHNMNTDRTGGDNLIVSSHDMAYSSTSLDVGMSPSTRTELSPSRSGCITRSLLMQTVSRSQLSMIWGSLCSNEFGQYDYHGGLKGESAESHPFSFLHVCCSSCAVRGRDGCRMGSSFLNPNAYCYHQSEGLIEPNYHGAPRRHEQSYEGLEVQCPVNVELEASTELTHARNQGSARLVPSLPINKFCQSTTDVQKQAVCSSPRSFVGLGNSVVAGVKVDAFVNHAGGESQVLDELLRPKVSRLAFVDLQSLSPILSAITPLQVAYGCSDLVTRTLAALVEPLPTASTLFDNCDSWNSACPGMEGDVSSHNADSFFLPNVLGLTSDSSSFRQQDGPNCENRRAVDECVVIKHNAGGDTLCSDVLDTLMRTVTGGSNAALFFITARSFPLPEVRKVSQSLFYALFRGLFDTMDRKWGTGTRAASTYSVKLSASLLRHDLRKDLLGECFSAPLSEISLSVSPLLGPKIDGLTFCPASTASEALAIFNDAYSHVSIDDASNSCVMLAAHLYQVQIHPTHCNSTQYRDVLLSSFSWMEGTPEVYRDVVTPFFLPRTSQLIRSCLEGPVLASVFVMPYQMSEAEQHTALHVQRIFRSIRTGRLQEGSVRMAAECARANAESNTTSNSFYPSIGSSTRHAPLEACDIHAFPLSALAHSTPLSSAGERPVPYIRQRLGTASQAGDAIRSSGTDARCKDQNGKISVTALKSIFKDCMLVLEEWNDTSALYTPNARECGASRFESGPMTFVPLSSPEDELAIGRWNKMGRSVNAPVRGSRVKGRVSGDRRAKQRAQIMNDWVPHVPVANILAGASSCSLGGIRPLFYANDSVLQRVFAPASDELYDSSALDPKTATTRKNDTPGRVQSVIILEEGRLFNERNSAVIDARRDGAGVTLSAVGTTVTARCQDGDTSRSFNVDEVVLQPAIPSKFPSQCKARSSVVEDALDAFANGYNISLLCLKEYDEREHSPKRASMLMASPIWHALTTMIATHLGSDASRAFYVSITQVVSPDCVIDRLAGVPVDTTCSPCDAGPGATCTTEEGKDTLLRFRSAWTPAGPIVEGARYVRIASLDTFRRLLLDVQQRMTSTPPTETLLLVSFLLHRRVSLDGEAALRLGHKSIRPGVSAASVAETCTSCLGVGAHFSSLSLSIASSTAAYTFLQVRNFFSMHDGHNVLCQPYCHRVVCVAEVSAGSHSALSFLDAQAGLVLQMSHPCMHYVWSMRSYACYLFKRAQALRNVIDQLRCDKGGGDWNSSLAYAHCNEWKSLPPNALGADMQTHRWRAERHPMEFVDLLRDGATVSVPDACTACLQLERMHSLALALLDGDTTTPTVCHQPSYRGGRGMKSVGCLSLALTATHGIYDITAPPACFHLPSNAFVSHSDYDPELSVTVGTAAGNMNPPHWSVASTGMHSPVFENPPATDNPVAYKRPSPPLHGMTRTKEVRARIITSGHSGWLNPGIISLPLGNTDALSSATHMCGGKASFRGVLNTDDAQRSNLSPNYSKHETTIDCRRHAEGSARNVVVTASDKLPHVPVSFAPATTFLPHAAGKGGRRCL